MDITLAREDIVSLKDYIDCNHEGYPRNMDEWSRSDSSNKDMAFELVQTQESEPLSWELTPEFAPLYRIVVYRDTAMRACTLSSREDKKTFLRRVL